MFRQGLRAPTRRLAAAFLGTALGLLGTTGASALTSPTAQYEVSPASITATAGGTYTVTLTDCGIVAGIPACSGAVPSFDSMDSATLTFAPGFAPATAGTVSSPSGSWTSSLSGGVVTLRANGSSNDLSFGQAVTVTLPAPLTVPAGPSKISTAAFDASGVQFSEIGSDPSFSVGPGPVTKLSYSVQPVETALNTTMGTTVEVLAQDVNNNPVPNVPVSLALVPNSDPLTGSSANSGPNGLASFPAVEVGPNAKVAGFNFTLTASTTAGTRPTTTSVPFTVASASTPCSGSCNLSANDQPGTTTTGASVSGSGSSSQLFITMFDPSSSVTPSVCSNAVNAQGSGSKIDLNNNSGASVTTTNRTLTWRLDKSVVNTISNNGASKYVICLGAVNLGDPACLTTDPSTAPTAADCTWTTKSGGKATPVFDSISGLWRFWGLLPTAIAGQPSIISQSKTNAGDVLIQISIPAPWDESLIGGLPRV